MHYSSKSKFIYSCNYTFSYSKDLFGEWEREKCLKDTFPAVFPQFFLNIDITVRILKHI